MERETRTRARAETRTETKTTRETSNVPSKSVFKCGEATVRIEYDAEAVIHNASPPGCFRATVVTNVTEQRMLVSAAKFRSNPANFVEEVARAALLYAAADAPDIIVLKKNAAGWPEIVKQ